jgi:hypothetical protein
LDFKGSACWKLLDADAVHVLGVLEQQLVVVRVLGHLGVLLGRLLVLVVVHDAVLVDLELAVLVGTRIFMVVDVSLEDDGVPSVVVLCLDQVQEIPDLESYLLSLLEIIDVLK